jgi:hypothetical protein
MSYLLLIGLGICLWRISVIDRKVSGMADDVALAADEATDAHHAIVGLRAGVAEEEPGRKRRAL